MREAGGGWVTISALGRRAAIAAVAFLLAAGFTPAAAADVVTIAAVGDNTLFQDATGSLSNGAGPVFFAGNNSQNLTRRALIRFDVAAAVPQGVVIADAVLTLNVSNAPNAIPRLFSLHRVLKDWGEGTSSSTGGSGATATPGDATWLHRFWPDSSWTNAGGDFEPAVSGSQSVGDVGPYIWTAPLMAVDVQAWLDDPTSNFGWVLEGDEANATTARRFDSRENVEPSVRPALTITYSVPTAVPMERDGATLGPCHPNPTSGAVRFELWLPAPGHATVIVTDAAGRLVATLIHGRLGPGRHEALWEGGEPHSHVAAGVYFCRLIVDGQSRATRRWVVLQ